VSGTTSYIAKFTSSSAIGNSAIYDNAGKIGIGTTVAGNPLEINTGGTISYGGNDIAYRNANGQTYLNNASGQSYWYSTLNLGLYAQEQLMMWVTNIRVGIATSGPAYTLDVNGNAHASSFVTSSDARFKKNVRPLTNSLQKITQLDGVVYEWNEFVNSRRDGYELNVPIVGLIAQDVEKIIPEIISKWKLSDDCEDARAIDYTRIVPYLIEAVKEQQVQITTLSNRLLAVESGSSN
jgi:hypothetical protein